MAIIEIAILRKKSVTSFYSDDEDIQGKSHESKEKELTREERSEPESGENKSRLTSSQVESKEERGR